MRPTFRAPVLLIVSATIPVGCWSAARGDDSRKLDTESKIILQIPPLSKGKPSAGKRVAITPREFAATKVFHTLYLPPDWQANGAKLPIIFEYTGNYYPPTGSTGQTQDAALGYCLSAGRYLWVSLPYISANQQQNAVRWWGDANATVAYAKRYVPEIVAQFGADPNAVFLCGFSRGAIGINYLGLHDEEIAKLWTAFISHDHFDGVKEWRGTAWGSPLKEYRRAALRRLERIRGRPYLVSQNGRNDGTEAYLRDALPTVGNFSFNYINAQEILGKFPNRFAKAGHTDRWAIKPSPARTRTWAWMNRVAAASPNK